MAKLRAPRLYRVSPSVALQLRYRQHTDIRLNRTKLIRDSIELRNRISGLISVLSSTWKSTRRNEEPTFPNRSASFRPKTLIRKFCPSLPLSRGMPSVRKNYEIGSIFYLMMVLSKQWDHRSCVAIVLNYYHDNVAIMLTMWISMFNVDVIQCYNTRTIQFHSSVIYSWFW